jgi:AcrR family transcriptional regulator
MPNASRKAASSPAPARAAAARPGPGRPRKLTHEKIVQAAITVMEREGFAALSTRSLARELGTTGSTLYNYVKRIEDIEIEALHALTAGLTPPSATTGPALRAELIQHLLSARRIILKHPRVSFPEPGSPTWVTLSELNAKWYAALAPYVDQPHKVVLAYTALIATALAMAERARLSGGVGIVRRHKSSAPFLRDVKLDTPEELFGLLIDQLMPGLSRP